MKHIFSLLLLTVFSMAASALDDVTMLPTRKKLAEDEKHNSRQSATVESKEIAYDVKVTSKAFKELVGVTIKYNIFYEVAQPGVKGDGEIKASSGSHVIPSLLTNKPVEFTTDSIKLEKSSLDGNYYYSSGASAVAKDKVVGLWFKAIDADGKLIGTYVNPTSILQKQKWKE